MTEDKYWLEKWQGKRRCEFSGDCVVQDTMHSLTPYGAGPGYLVLHEEYCEDKKHSKFMCPAYQVRTEERTKQAYEGCAKLFGGDS